MYEVLSGAELRGVDEDAQHDPIRVDLRDAHQREMPLVQAPHGRD